MDAKLKRLEGTCFFCLGKARKTWCRCCEKDFILNVSRCPTCARSRFTNKPCGTCLKEPPFFTSTEVLFNYQYPGNHLIKAYKFNDRPELACSFATQLVHKLPRAGPLPEALIPVPLHKQRQQERGYNQSLELAKCIGKHLGIKVNATLCHRKVNTERQSTLPMRSRKNNVKGAFEFTYANPYDHIVIVDDVITTGSTVNEIAALFKNSGCSRVDVWAIART